MRAAARVIIRVDVYKRQGYITLKEVKGKGTIHIYYGESPEEALDTEYCETLATLQDRKTGDFGCRG